MAKPLTLQELQGLMGLPTPEITQLVDQIVTTTIQTLESKLDFKGDQGIKPPTVLYDLKGHHGGWAIGGHTVRLNIDLLNNPASQQEMLNQVIPHEVAHIVVQQKWPGAKGHGNEWKLMMHLLGLPADRCHQLETTAQRKYSPRKRDQVLWCSCNPPEHPVTITIYRRFLEGRRYKCSKCNATLRKEQ